MSLFVVSLLGEVLSNDRPLVVRYDGHYYFPIVKDYPETLFGGDFPARANYLDPYIRSRLQSNGNFAIYPPNHFRYDTIDYFAAHPYPGAAHRVELARHRSIRTRRAARLLYGFVALGADGARADGLGRADRRRSGRDTGLLRRPHRSDRPAPDRDLELDARPLSAHHLRVASSSRRCGCCSFFCRCSAGSCCPTMCARNSCATVRSTT